MTFRKNSPPDSTTLLSDYSPSDKLNLSITQLNLTPYQQNKLIDSWCKKLPELENLKFLWFCSRVNQRMFDAACNISTLEGLSIKWSGIKDISKLVNLKSLKYLYIGSSTQIESISPLKDMKNLESLYLVNLKKITDFSIVQYLQELTELGIDGSMWTTQKIETLEPIAQLKKLRILSLKNTRTFDKSFDPILQLKNLVQFDSSWNYPEKEFEKLKALPNLKYGNIETSWKEIQDYLGRNS